MASSEWPDHRAKAAPQESLKPKQRSELVDETVPLARQNPTSHSMAPSILVNLADSPGPKVLGMTVRQRNERVVARSGASLVEGLDHPSPVLVVPESIVLERSLFETLSKLEPPCRLAADGAEIEWGHVSSESPTYAVACDDFIDVSTKRDRAHAERRLLRSTEKPTDGLISRHFNRPQSRFFSRWFLKAGLNANAASAVSFLLGIACGFAAAQPGGLWLAATGVLFQFASMFDGVDGEMARVTLQDSKYGAAIDTTVDNFTYLATLVGFGIGWAREGITTGEGWFLLTVSAAIIVTLFQVWAFVRRHAPDASFVFFDSSLRRAARETGSLSLRAIDLMFRATRRDLLAFLLMFVCLFGSRLAILTLVAIGVILANYVLLFRRADLAQAAGLLRGERAS